jgi:hypothetical protein
MMRRTSTVALVGALALASVVVPAAALTGRSKSVIEAPSLQADVKRIASALESANGKAPATDRKVEAKTLKAQQDTVFWAMMMFCAAVFEASVTALGVYLVYRTLGEAKRTATGTIEAANAARASADAAAEAAKVASLASRPWVKFSVSSVIIYLMPTNPQEVGCQIHYEYENIGDTPAIHAGLVFAPVPVSAQNPPNWTEQIKNLIDKEPRQPRALFPGEKVISNLSTNFPFPPQPNEDAVTFSVVAGVTYKTHATGMIHSTFTISQLQQKTPPADRIFRFLRGMGIVECIVMYDGSTTPDPT